MNKILQIGWKDLIVLFRDRGALVLMLGAPFVLTLGLGLITGSFSGGGGSGLAGIAVVVVNEDSGELGQALENVFFSSELADLLAPDTAVSPQTARQLVNQDEIAAAVIIPAGFTDSILPDENGQLGQAVSVEVYANPARPISAGVVGSIVQDFVNQIETNMLSVNVAMTQMVVNGRISPTDTDALMSMGQEMGQRLAVQDAAQIILIERDTAAAATTNETNFLAYIAPGMAVAFLMYTVALGGRSILAERDKGTLARLLISPTSATQVLAGKVVGIFLTGTTQVGVLIAASSLLFGLRWGSLPGVILLIVTVAAAATGWGLLLASLADRPSQVASFGTALMLVFGILGGSFVQIPFTGFLAQMGKITPNAWAISGFTTLSQGGTVADIVPPLAALVVMAVVLFGAAVLIFQRRAGALIAR